MVAVVVGLVGVLLLADRLTAAGVFDRRTPRPRVRRPGGAPAGALGGLLDFYDPSHRHLTEEQDRERSTTVQVPGEAPPLIDLDSGVAELPGPAGQAEGERTPPTIASAASNDPSK